MELLIASLASGLAGFIDAIVGGGGLILAPALFALFPTAHPATLFGTNKGAAIAGTAFAAVRYTRQVSLPWRSLLPAMLVCFAASLTGAWLVTQISPHHLRKALPFILLLVLGYTLAKKKLGRHHLPRYAGRQEMLMTSAIGCSIGLYDGFFGPGTGSFLVFFLVRVLGYDFLHASAGAKLLNTASNAAAILLFALTGHIWWHYVLVMAVANVIGSFVGTHLALQHGTGFVRKVFIAVVSALILKTAYDGFVRGL